MKRETCIYLDGVLFGGRCFFNEENKIVNDIAAEGMIGILRPLGLSK